MGQCRRGAFRVDKLMFKGTEGGVVFAFYGKQEKAAAADAQCVQRRRLGEVVSVTQVCALGGPGTLELL